MSTITAEEFHDAAGAGGWHVEGDAAVATYATGSFAKGVELVVEIGRLADAANHHPDVDLRYPSVRVLLTTHDAGGLTDRDVALARQVSGAARGLGIEAQPEV